MAQDAVAPAPFRKDLSHIGWDEVLRRQERRGALVPAWIEALGLRPGMRVLDVGAGPGYVSARLAQQVGPAGQVLALDQAPATLPYLERLRTARGLTWVRPIIADVMALDLSGERIDGALITMMLHHVDDAPAVLRQVARWLDPGVRCVVAEFDPAGPCTSGPPAEHRIAPAQAQVWCEQAGFTCLTSLRQSDEHYMLVLERSAR